MKRWTENWFILTTNFKNKFYIEVAILCFCFCVIPVLLYSLLSFKYSSLHLFLKSSSSYHLIRHSFKAAFSFLHLKVIKILLFLQHSVNFSTTSTHFSFRAISRIFFGIMTSISTLLKDKSSGSPEIKICGCLKIFTKLILSEIIIFQPQKLTPKISTHYSRYYGCFTKGRRWINAKFVVFFNKWESLVMNFWFFLQCLKIIILMK